MDKILIKNLMTSPVICAAASTPLIQIVEIMKEDRHSCMVITRDDIPIGIITERDIVRNFAGALETPNPAQITAVHVMTSPVITVSETCPLFEALVIARSNQIRHLPVTGHDGKLTGVVTQTDMVAAHFRIIEKQRENLEHAVAERTQELLETNAKLQELSLEDPLLKIGNRRAMEIDLEHTHAAAHRYQRPYSIILLDVDHFKHYNEYYGHLEADKVLKEIAALLKTVIRKSDRVYRYGGEEILLLLPETLPDGAQAMAQRVLDEVVIRAIPHETEPLKVVTISGGISGSEPTAPDEPWFDVVQRADCALFAAKTAGRNRVFSLYVTETDSYPAPARFDA
ncbi:MAG TPA: diguanylate cyclase [Candidatus Binatia bacterium]|jgi:diguanylate cyclase (GGDEF)-like protein